MTSTVSQIERVFDTTQSPHSPSCAELMIMAELELAAFLSAVTELYGAEEAEVSAEVWLDELDSRISLPGATSCDWRTVTVAALARLASRLPTTKASPIPSSDCSASALLV